jgi:hypothetical protein
MFYISQKIRTSNQVSKKDYETLKANGIKPGSPGEIVDIVYVIKFENTTIELEENSLDYNDEKNYETDSTLDQLKNMFGMK